MATEDRTAGETRNNHSGARQAFVVENRIDAAANNVASGDVIETLNVYAGWFVERVVVEVETAEGGTLTIDVGDGSDADGYLDGEDANGTGYKNRELTLTDGTPNTVTGYSAGKLYTSDDTIDVTFNNAADAAVMRVAAVVVDMSGLI